MERTVPEGAHGEQAREHALVVAVEHTADAGKGRDAQHLPILQQSARARSSHELLATLERGIVEGAAVITASGHRSWSV